jgi:hypothetical protein
MPLKMVLRFEECPLACLHLLFFPHEALDEDVQHGKTHLRLGDDQAAFGIFSRCFAQIIYVVNFPPLSKLLILPTFIQVFGRFIGLGLLECP